MGQKKIRLSRVFICLFLSFLMISSFSTNTFAQTLTARERLIYSQNNLVFYNPYEQFDCEEGGGAGIVSGDDNKAKVWNYFVTANIPGVSDNPAVIAGIMGNIQQESGFNPFDVSGGKYYGLYQTDFADFKNNMETAGLFSYFGKSNEDVPTDINDKAIKVELDTLVAGDRFQQFTNHLDWVSNTSGPGGAKSYAELFLVEIERAVGGSSPLEDSRVQDYVKQVLYPKGNPSMSYQETNKRRDYAEEFYNIYADSSIANANSSNSSSGSSGGSSISWDNDGWIEGMPGITKDDVTQKTDLNETILGKEYLNGKPNKILLHSTEGTSNGYNAYPAGNKYPAHFIIDLKKKEGYQNIPLNLPSTATKGGDSTTVQIEIVGFSGSNGGEYSLQTFSDEDWDYLAVLLAAIANRTGIPLTTSVDWNDVSHSMSHSEFDNLTGIVGHRHAPGDDHDDPGNIWDVVDAAIKRNPDASKFGKSNICKNSDEGGLKSGGMNLEEAIAFMKIYRDITPREVSQNPQLAEWKIPDTGCTTDLENCVAFSTYFINRYTTLSAGSLGNGSEVASNLSKNYDLPSGTEPRPYAVFSTASGTTMCGNVLCGHTGVVLGVDTENNKIIIGEAGCHSGFDFTNAKEKELDKFSDGSYTYAYTDTIIKTEEIKK